jgi:hypothetical protein
MSDTPAKPKRTLNPKLAARAAFIKANYDKVRHLPNKERLKALSEMYRTEHPEEPKGGSAIGGISAIPSGGSVGISAVPAGGSIPSTVVPSVRAKGGRRTKVAAV